VRAVKHVIRLFALDDVDWGALKPSQDRVQHRHLLRFGPRVVTLEPAAKDEVPNTILAVRLLAAEIRLPHRDCRHAC
jgi:hypothetical protein